MLAQRKEIKRLEKEADRRLREAEEEVTEKGVEEKERALVDFERVMMGLEGAQQKKTNGRRVEPNGELVPALRGTKRKFELDEEEMLNNAKAERVKARQALDDEKVCTLFIFAFV